MMRGQYDMFFFNVFFLKDSAADSTQQVFFQFKLPLSV